MKVSQVLKSKGAGVITVGPDEAIGSVLRRYGVHHIGALVVVDDADHLLGVLGERDLVNGLISKGKRLLDLSVQEVMSKGGPTCGPDDSVRQAMELMTDHRTRHIPVLDGDRLAGLISIGDAVKALLEDAEVEARILRDMARARR